MGYAQAGFDVMGVDIREQKHYPFEHLPFINLTEIDDLNRHFPQASAFHASPPCQLFSIGTKKYRNQGKEYPDVLTPLRQKLLATGKPFIIENVPGAPLRRDLVLCGEMFGLRVIRHRIFEIHGFTVLQPPHIKHKTSLRNGTAVGVYGSNGTFYMVGKDGYQEKYAEFKQRYYSAVYSGQPGGWGKSKEDRKKSYYATVAGHGGDSFSYLLHEWRQAMGIDWMNKRELTQAIPPAYTEFIGRQVIQYLLPEIAS